MASLSLKNIYKVYPNGTKAVNDFCMDIEDKEFIVFVGPSGCGKSTVLRMIAGLEEISAGELKIGDRVVNDVECKSRDTAMVFQNYALYPHMTVADNMAFPLKMIKLTKEQKEDLRRRADEKYPRKSGQAPVLAEGEKKGIFNNPFCNTVLRPLRVWQTRREDMYKTVIKIAEILGLEEYLGKKPGAMSGGQRQRVALGRAMVRNPQVFLLDEPLSNLDAKLRTQMRSEITKLHNRVQTTFIYVTHDQVEAMTMGDRIVVMKKGTIQQIDTPINLYSYPANMFVAGFIGTPSMNFFDAVVENDGKASVTFAGGKKLEFSSEYIKKMERKYFGKNIVMGVRPEDFVLSDEGVECAVLSTEMLGSETLLYCDFDTENVTNYDAGKFPLIIKIDGVCARKCGDIIKVSINFDKMHFFDKESEESVMKRFVSYNEISVKAESGKLAIGGISATLPPALSNLEGELTAVFPTDAICKGESYEAEVLECEKLKEGWLARLNIGSEKLYALFNEEVCGSIKVDVLWNKVTLNKGETVVKEALKTDNVFNIKLEKRALSGAQKKALPEDEKRAFDVDIVCGETKLTCPVSVLKRLLSASDRKLFGVDMQLIFGENAINAENTFTAKVVEKYDYGHGKYAKCRCLDTDIILPYEGGEEIKFGIDLTKASVYDVALGIKIT